MSCQNLWHNLKVVSCGKFVALNKYIRKVKDLQSLSHISYFRNENEKNKIKIQQAKENKGWKLKESKNQWNWNQKNSRKIDQSQGIVYWRDQQNW